jgi:hypothetical protein
MQFFAHFFEFADLFFLLTENRADHFVASAHSCSPR